MEADKISEDDLDEEAIKPFMDPDNSQARIDHIQCINVIQKRPWCTRKMLVIGKAKYHHRTQGCMDLA